MAENGVLRDGASHYSIDSTTERTGIIPILRYDTVMHAYEALLATIDGVRPDEIFVMSELADASTGDDDWW